MKKYVFLIVGILILSLPFWGVPIIFKHKQHELKKSIKWKLIEESNDNELVILKFLKTETDRLLEWKHSREFKYQGYYYDIVKSNCMGDSIAYFCWWDYNETVLYKKLENLLGNALHDNPATNKSRINWQKFTKNLYFNTLQYTKPPKHILYKTVVFKNNARYISRIVCPDPPPPQNAFVKFG
jgi:hypothetical protein